jgi:hypothetical protein
LRVEGGKGKAPEGDKHLANSSGFCEGDKFLTGSLSDGTAKIAKFAKGGGVGDRSAIDSGASFELCSRRAIFKSVWRSGFFEF